MRQIFVKDRELKFNRLFSLSYIAVAAVLPTQMHFHHISSGEKLFSFYSLHMLSKFNLRFFASFQESGWFKICFFCFRWDEMEMLKWKRL